MLCRPRFEPPGRFDNFATPPPPPSPVVKVNVPTGILKVAYKNYCVILYYESEIISPNLSHKTGTLGLSGLTASVLGRPLQKAEQISDWSRRPLRASQLTYAALDAYVGLEIFMQLRQRARDLGAEEVFARCVAEMVGGKTPKKGGTGGERKSARMKLEEEEEGLPEVQPLLTDPIPPSGLRYRTIGWI
jgi:hypothetical protein